MRIMLSSAFSPSAEYILGTQLQTWRWMTYGLSHPSDLKLGIWKGFWAGGEKITVGNFCVLSGPHNTHLFTVSQPGCSKQRWQNLVMTASTQRWPHKGSPLSYQCGNSAIWQFCHLAGQVTYKFQSHSRGQLRVPNLLGTLFSLPRLRTFHFHPVFPISTQFFRLLF